MPVVETAAVDTSGGKYTPINFGSYPDGRDIKQFYPATDEGRRAAMLDFGSRISSIRSDDDTTITVTSDEFGMEYRLNYNNGVLATIYYFH